MNYNDILLSHQKYGSSKDDIISRNQNDKILENVVIAPWWNHDIFSDKDFNIEKINDKVYNISNNKMKFSFIELHLIGSPVIMDEVLSLGVTKCKNLIFIGSVGGITENIRIGDLVIPKYSICGEGASRYLNPNLEDNFGNKEYPNEELYNKVKNIIDKKIDKDINCHYTVNYSIDTIFNQYYHLDKIKEFGAETIEMETSALFKSSKIAGIKSIAIFCVSDNTILNKSLFNGRTKEDKENKKITKNSIIPNIIVELFENI